MCVYAAWVNPTVVSKPTVNKGAFCEILGGWGWRGGGVSSLEQAWMFPQFAQTSHFPAWFHSSARKEEEDLRAGSVDEEVVLVRAGGCVFEESSGKLSGRGLHPASELIGTALLFYPPTERVAFGSHWSRWPASSLSRPSLLEQRGAPPAPPCCPASPFLS